VIKIRVSKQKRNRKIAIAAIAVLFISFLVYLLAFSGFSPFSGTQTPTTGNSTFQLISYVDGEDVSDFVEISVWVPDSNAEFDETEDIYTWSNFEEEESSKDADDVSVDLSGIEYAWLEIDPDAEAVFANNHHLLIGGKNYAYKFYVYHQSSDVNFGCMNETMGETWSNFTTAGALPIDPQEAVDPFGWRDAPAGNFTLAMDVPQWTYTNTHVGSNWDIEQSEYDDYSSSELEFVHAEANWRCQAPTYNPATDLEKSGEEDGLEALTNAFVIRWTYNTSVSTTDGAATQINMTITDDTNAEVVIDGTYIYMIFTDVIDFEDGPVLVDFEYQEATDIYASNVQSGRLVVPRDEDSLGAFTAYSVIGR
jgi:hypothetical protein